LGNQCETPGRLTHHRPNLRNTLSSTGVFTQAQIDTIAAAPARIHDGVTLTLTERQLVVEAYTLGLRHVWYMAIPCAGLSFVLAVTCIKARAWIPPSHFVAFNSQWRPFRADTRAHFAAPQMT
jgi:hypothetical protein